ncbi:MAG TPA: hypothetical protein VLI06_11780 [Solimonas sp.]|nr:hypothetical protein [Solimonas sp.]
MRPAQLLAVCALCVSANAFATSFDSLDLYFVNSKIEAPPAGDFDGDGFGGKFRGSVGDDFFFSGEYQSLSDGDNGDYNEWRVGLGLPFGRYSSMTPYGLLEYINTEFDAAGLEDDGIGAHLGLLFHPMQELSLYGQAGYIGLREADGYEWLVGAALQLRSWGGLFAEYRNAELEVDDGGGDLETKGVRAGIYLLVSQ